jgi:RNA-directed DNA polymerase
MAVLLVIGPIFEADLCREQYAFRPERSAKMAIQKAYYYIAKDGLTEIVDADLSNYFNTIPHGALVRCLSRRIADGYMLSVKPKIISPFMGVTTGLYQETIK